MKVLLIGHACDPGAGSEPGLTWHWAKNLAREHEVTVLAHPHFVARTEQHLARHPEPRLRIEAAAVPRALDPWDPAQDERRLRLHYLLWLRFAHRRARDLVAARGIDIVHHVSLGTLSAPPPFWRLPVPFVWGPLGGGQTAPDAFSRLFGDDWRAERRRALRLRLVALSPGFRQAARRADCVFATNAETRDLLRAAGAENVRFLADNGIAPDALAGAPRAARRDGRLTLLWAGRMESRKGLPLLLSAMAALRGDPVDLLVAGDGPRRADYEALALRLDVKARFLGRLPPREMPDLFRRVDGFVFTSLQDSLGSVTLDALAAGLPLITLDHQGQAAVIPATAALKAPVETPEATVAGLARAIRRLQAEPALGARLSLDGLAFARTLLWPDRARAMSGVYAEISQCREARRWTPRRAGAAQT